MTSITAPTTLAAGAGTASTGLATDVQGFLRLLTTQLRNQDPTQPLDPNAMTQQLAQFAGVEQQIATNRHMESLLGLQQASALLAAAPLVGQRVQAASDGIVLAGGTTQALRLPAATEAGATRARIALADASGTVQREAIVPLGTAATAWTWDGRASNGRAAADGAYRVTITALDSSGTARGTLPTFVTGNVTSIAREEGAPQLSLGALSLPLASLRRLE